MDTATAGIAITGAARVVLHGVTFVGPASGPFVTLDGATECDILGNTFVGGGASAILLSNTTDSSVRQNLILYPGASGVELRDGSARNLVSDNVVQGPKGPETHGGGIFLHGVRDNLVSHNLVQSAEGFGIGIANWDDTTVNYNNTVESNVLRNTALNSTDSGAIYLLGRSGENTRTVIANNVIDTVGSAKQHSVGIYLDDSTGGTVVTRNLIRGAGSDAIQIHGGSDNLVENNLLDLGHDRPSAVLFQAAPADTHPLNAQTGNSVVGNIIMSAHPQPKLFISIDGGRPQVAGNAYCFAQTPVAAETDVTDAAPRVMTCRPDAFSGDYGIVQAEAWAAIGFRKLDPDAAGPRRP